MASYRWTGAAGDLSLDTVGNWEDNGGGSYATSTALPVSGDSVLIAYGSQAITVASSWAAIDLAALTITFGGTIGGNGSSWTVAVSSGSTPKLKYSGTGAFVNITAGTNGIDKAVVQSGTLRLSGGTWIDVEGGEGANIDVEAGAVISTSLKLAGAGCQIAANATDLPTLEAYRSSVRSYRDIDDITVGIGSQVWGLYNATVDTKVKVHEGGIYYHHSRGTIALSEVLPGGIATDANGTHPFTVTNRTTWRGGSNFRNAKNSITFTNAENYVALSTV